MRELVRRIEQLLPNAEARENAVEQVVRVNRAGHFTECINRAAERQRQQFRRLVVRGE